MTGDSVAVKVLRPSSEGPNEDTTRLIGEARAMSAVRHPHVVRVLDAGISDMGEAFVVMELEQGTSLQQLVEQGLVTPPRAVDLAQQMLEGLAAVHAQGIIHRDIKPSNVLVSPLHGKDFVRLLDFGISKVPSMGAMTLPGSSMGTPGFMAPELFGNAAGADPRADVYGVAATLFYILSGRLPFDAPTYEDLVVMVRTQRAPALRSFAPHVPPPLGDAIDRGLARDRDARWPDALSFAVALGASMNGLHANLSSPTLATNMSAMPRPLSAPPSTSNSPTVPANNPYAMQQPMFRDPAPLLSPLPPPMMSPLPPAPLMSPMPPSPMMSHAMPLDTSTGRAAPPVAGTIQPSGTSFIGWVLGMAAGAGLLVLVAASAFMVMKMRDGSPTDPSTPSTTETSTSTSTPTPPSTPTPTPTQTQAPTPTQTGAPAVAGHHTRVLVAAPKVVGRVSAGAMSTLTAHAMPEAQRCAVAKHEVVMVDLFVQETGDISIAQPNQANTGDKSVADCVANAYRDAAAKGWNPGGAGGIVTVTATLDP